MGPRSSGWLRAQFGADAEVERTRATHTFQSMLVARAVGRGTARLRRWHRRQRPGPPQRTAGIPPGSPTTCARRGALVSFKVFSVLFALFVLLFLAKTEKPAQQAAWTCFSKSTGAVSSQAQPKCSKRAAITTFLSQPNRSLSAPACEHDNDSAAGGTAPLPTAGARGGGRPPVPPQLLLQGGVPLRGLPRRAAKGGEGALRRRLCPFHLRPQPAAPRSSAAHVLRNP